jgi:acetyl esterase/lipase
MIEKLRIADWGLRIGTALMTLSGASAPIASAQDYFAAVNNPRTELLWPDGAPGALGTDEADKPTLIVYLPVKPQATGAGIVVCPGGSYSHLAMDHEGHQPARWLTSRGIAAFVLTYRLGPKYHHPAMLQDVLRAIRVVRSRATEFGVRPDRIGVMGFSAGGHLASSAATLFDRPEGHPRDGLEQVSSRPDFAVLVYPVIAMGQTITNKGSQKNLLGENPPQDMLDALSTDKQVTSKTPPTFLFHTDADPGVVSENSVQFYLALRKGGVAAELHIYQKGDHGVGLAPGDPVLSKWPDRLLGWLQVNGFLELK